MLLPAKLASHRSIISKRCTSRRSYWRATNLRSHQESVSTPDATAADSPVPKEAPKAAEPRNILVAVGHADEFQDASGAIDWTIQHFVQPGDKMHLLHVVPSLTSGWLSSLPAETMLEDHAAPPPAETADAHDSTSDSWRGQQAGEHAHEHAGGVAGQAEAAAAAAAAPEEEHFKLLWSTLMQRLVGEKMDAAQVPYYPRLLHEPSATDKPSVGATICRESRQLRADLVVLASQARGGLGELISGSVAQQVLHNCQEPVVVLHVHKHYDSGASLAAALSRASDEAPAAGEAGEGAVTGGGRNIMVAIAASNESEDSCRWTLKNLYRPGDTIHLVHVIPCLLLSNAVPPFAGIVPVAYHGSMPKEQADQEAQVWRILQMRRFTKIMEEAGAKFTFDTIVEYTQDPTSTIGHDLCRMAAHLNAKAVVLAAHKHNNMVEMLFGSVTNHVTHHCEQPVILLPGQQQQQ